MKKILILLSTTALLLLSGCALGGADEADKLRGTWVSDYAYNNYYAYYDFDPQKVDGFDGDHTGRYRIRQYTNNYWSGTSYNVVEEGRYSADYLSGEITLSPDFGGFRRTFDYKLTDHDLYLNESYSWWGGARIHLRKIN